LKRQITRLAALSQERERRDIAEAAGQAENFCSQILNARVWHEFAYVVGSPIAGLVCRCHNQRPHINPYPVSRSRLVGSGITPFLRFRSVLGTTLLGQFGQSPASVEHDIEPTSSLR
jgi:hypothetical protein